MRKVLPVLVCLAFPFGFAQAQETKPAGGDLLNRDAKKVGTVAFKQMPQGVVIRIEVEGLQPGWHGIHIHGVGKCEPPFATAGGHFNPANHKHGFGETGPHAGDLPNIYADANGKAIVEVVTTRVSLVEGDKAGAFLMGPNGTALVIHAGPDDYQTDPAGNSGDRVVCGVI